MVDDQEDPRLYLRIAADLRARITSGELIAGQPVPSITTLAQRWEVSRRTVAHAFQVLEDEGLVRRYPGRGYYVTKRG